MARGPVWFCVTLSDQGRMSTNGNHGALFQTLRIQGLGLKRGDRIVRSFGSQAEARYASRGVASHCAELLRIARSRYALRGVATHCAESVSHCAELLRIARSQFRIARSCFALRGVASHCAESLRTARSCFALRGVSFALRGVARHRAGDGSGRAPRRSTAGGGARRGVCINGAFCRGTSWSRRARNSFRAASAVRSRARGIRGLRRGGRRRGGSRRSLALLRVGPRTSCVKSR
jgi:hypothetical protein